MKKRAKVLICALLVFMITGLFSGCNSKKTDNDSKQASNSVAEAEGEKMTFVWCGQPYSNVTAKEGTDVELYLEDKFNIELKPVFIDKSEYDEKLNLKMTSGEIPDLIFSYSYNKNWVDSGLVAEIPMSEIKSNMPMFYKMINDNYPEIWYTTQTDGTNYAIRRVYYDGAFSSACLWRRDWLTNVGIDKIPETIDEMEEALRRFVYNDPDKNGQDDTIGLTAGKDTLNVQGFAEIFGAYGNQSWVWQLKDGVVTYGCIAPEAKEALAKLAEWYKEGLIDKEYMTREDFLGLNLAKANKVGYTSNRFYVAWDKYPNGWASQIESSVTGADIDIGPLPEGPAGYRGSYRFGSYNNYIFFGEQLNSDKAKREKLLQILDEITMDWDTAVRLNWGIQGTHWDYIDPKVGEDSGMKTLAPYDTDMQARANEGLSSGPFTDGQWGVNLIDISFRIKSFGKEFQSLFSKYADVPHYRDDIYEGPLIGTLESSDLYEKDLIEMKIAAYTEIITGAKPVSYFDTFVKEWLAAGGEQLTKEAQESYESVQKYVESIK